MQSVDADLTLLRMLKAKVVKPNGNEEVEELPFDLLREEISEMQAAFLSAALLSADWRDSQHSIASGPCPRVWLGLTVRHFLMVMFGGWTRTWSEGRIR